MKHTYKFIWFIFLLTLFYAASAQAQETNCSNGVDDDGDGLIDCADGDCNFDTDGNGIPDLPVCALEAPVDPNTGQPILNPQTGLPFNCSDGIDNDGDGLTDCQEPGCLANATVCPSESDCNNGIDDDNDGFIDYYDGDCLLDPSNPNDYIITKPDCEAVPVGNVFEIEEEWKSDDGTSAVYGLPSVADLDQDGVPEVITLNDQNGMLYILNGQDGSIIRSVDIGSNAFAYPAVGDVDGDGTAEIFVMDRGGRIRAYHHDLTDYWGRHRNNLQGVRMIGLADFNLDGVPEVYYANEILNAQTGDVIVEGTHGIDPNRNWDEEVNGMSVAVDILPDSYCTDCSGLELIAGSIIYAVDIASGTLTEVLHMDDAASKILVNPIDGFTYDATDEYRVKHTLFGTQVFSSTSVVDLNQDGHLDVILSGTLNNERSGPTMVFFWDIHNDRVTARIVSRPHNTIPGAIRGNFRDVNNGSCDAGEECTWRRGMGVLNIANIDGDPELEITFMSGSSLYALDNQLNEEWANHSSFFETSSGFTGTAVFDFDGDGASEIIYRDEIDLYIVDGTTGQPLNGFLSGTFCSSNTQAEYPIVADIDGDGETEIVVSCGCEENFIVNGDEVQLNTSSTRSCGYIRAYKASGDNYWVPARSVWNQTLYFNVNINDNLTIPNFAQPHHLSFSQICNDPSVPTAFPLNKFLNQSPRISFCGQLAFPAPKLDFADDGVVISPPVCPDNQFEVRLIFENNGDQAVNGPIPVAFYADDPTVSYGNSDESPYLETIDLNIPGGVLVGQKVDTTVIVNADRGEFELFVSLNDRGQYDSLGAPMTNENFYPLTSLNGTVRECDDNLTIVSKQVIPLPFDVQAVLIRDNRNCPGSPSNNGEIQVIAYDGTSLPASSYDFTWTNIHTGQVVSSDALVTSLDSGTYRVEVVNTDYNCTGNADTVTVRRFEDWPDTQVVTLEQLQAVSACTPGTADGVARVLINGAPVDETSFDIEWEDEQQPGVLAIGDTATNLQPILYKVTVYNKLTGCSESQTIDMTLELPDLAQPTVTSNTNCKNPNGSITAKLNTGNKSDYEYILVQHSPVQDTLRVHNNGAFTNLDEGVYELKAYNPTTFCGLYSNGIMVDVTTSKSIDDIPIQVAQEQSSCAFPYNGQLTAVLSNTNKYDWVWYRGTVTSGPTADTVGTDYITPDTLSTNTTDMFTVVATDRSSGCSFTGQIQLTENIVIPIADANDFTVAPQTTCSPNGSIQATVSNTEAGVVYEYTLLQGSTVIGTNNTGLFENLEAGPYVVEVRNTTNFCESNPSSIVQVGDNITLFGDPTVTYTPVTNCDPSNPNGAVTITMPLGNADYEFKWFVGVDTATALSPQPATAHELTNVAAGDYTLSVHSNLTGCDTLINSIKLEDISAQYQDQITATVTRDQEFCFPNVFSGEIEASFIQSALGGVPDTSDYTYYWYAGRKNDVRNNTVTPIAGENNAKITGLDIGWYSVRAVKNDASGCHAIDTAEVRIDDIRDFPITTVNITVVDQSSCNSNDPNGSLIGDVGGNTTDYNFTWYQLIGGIRTDITVNNPTATINGHDVQDIGVGTYVLVAENINTGCTGEAQVYLQDNIITGSEIRLNLSSTNATQCTPPNGVAEVNSIDLSEDGGSTFTMTDVLSNYTYQWYYGEDTTTAVDPATNITATTARLENIEPGMYTVKARNINSQCASVSYTVEVRSDVQDNLVASITHTEQSASGCINPDGSIEVTSITGGTGPFTYQWFKGRDDTYPLAGETSAILDNIRSDNYMVRITDVATGCFKDEEYNLPPNAAITPVPPATLSVVEHATTCDPSSYNGRLVAEVDPGVLTLTAFSSHTADDFFYYWFKGEDPSYINPNATPIDDVNNFAVINNDLPVIGDNKAEISNLEPGFYTVIVVDAYDYIRGGSLGCRSDPRTFEVRAMAQSPQVAFTTQNDSYCVGDNGEATLTIGKKAIDSTPFSGFEIIDATQNGSSFFPLPVSVIVNQTDDAIARQTSISLTQMNAGSYRFTLQDEHTLCDTTISLDIADRSVAPVLAFDNVQVNSHQTSCFPDNGEAEVIVSASTTGLTNLADYQFYWHDSEAATSAEITDPGTYLQTGTLASGLAAGEYFVYAVNNTTGCNSSFQVVEIEERVPSTLIQIISSTSDTDCDVTNGNGNISVSISDEDFDGNTVYPVGGYTISWEDENGVDYTTQATTNGGTQPATSILPNLNEGTYIISVVNNETQCDTAIARETILLEPFPISYTASSLLTTPNTNCFGNGEAEIVEVRRGNTVITNADAAFADFSFEWRTSDDITTLPPTGPLATDLNTGSYYVYVTDIVACDTARLLINIDEDIIQPFVYEHEVVDFISCTGVNEGAIEVFGGESDPSVIPALGYDYEWTMADGSAMPVYTVYNADSSRITNLTPGSYRVVMTNRNTGCTSEGTYTINTRSILPVLLASKLTDQSYCFGNGAAQVDDVTFAGASVNVNDYRFFWYEAELNSSALTSPTYGLGLDSLSADSLVAGTYFVVAENRVSGCRTLPVQVNIEDTSAPLVVILDDISEPITACDPSNFPDGDIEIDVRNGENVISSWYEGYTIVNPADSIPGYNNSFEIDNLVPGAYTVWVMDTLTGCSTTRTYTIEGIEVPIVVNTSSKSFSSCILPNGMVAANVNGGSGDYIFTWFVENESGTTQLDVPDNTNYVEGLINGTYTVEVQDRLEPYCDDARSEIVVEDSRGEEIMLEVNTDFQMTNCDATKPNGQLSVEVSGDLSRYNFFWYEGTNTDNQPFASGPIVGNLTAGDYTVIARDKVSGCVSNEFTGSVISQPDTTTIPAPVVIARPVTRCDEPNGSAEAVMDSTLIDPNVDYIYTWYNEEGEEVFSSFRKNEVNFLSAGNYSVVVTNSLSGCASSSAEFSIGEEIYTPEFEILSTPSTCLEANGTIMIDFVEPIRVVDIEWITPEGYATGFFLSNQPPGHYELSITDDKGCVHTKSGVIMSNIHVYNGVSPNGDGKNDRFIISCIGQFQDNTVKIYNRAGALVYEDFSYDNEYVYFEGIGNRGLYIGGEELPEGTYYYIIDKKNGEEPESGFLELLR